MAIAIVELAQQPVGPVSVVAFEKHYRVKDLARMWAVSYNTAKKWVDREQGVIRDRSMNAGKRAYTLRTVPESVVLRIHERLCNQSLKTPLPSSNPLRVVRLRDLDGGMAQKPRNVVKLKTSKQLSDCKRVA